MIFTKPNENLMENQYFGARRGHLGVPEIVLRPHWDRTGGANQLEFLMIPAIRHGWAPPTANTTSQNARRDEFHENRLN